MTLRGEKKRRNWLKAGSLRLNQGRSSDGQLLVDVGVSDWAEAGVWPGEDIEPEGRRHSFSFAFSPVHRACKCFLVQPVFCHSLLIFICDTSPLSLETKVTAAPSASPPSQSVSLVTSPLPPPWMAEGTLSG